MKKSTNLDNKLFSAAVFALFALAAFFRFAKLSGLHFFTYDQARDALFIKRILDGQLRLIGTQSSIPGLYTGPFYYYLLAPFLFLFRLNPVGLDFATAFFSLASVGVFFLLAKKFIKSKWLALLLSTTYALSPILVAQARFAWNPNPLPFFTLLIIYSLSKIILDKKANYFLLLGFSLGLAINLHYSGLGLIFILFLTCLLQKRQFLANKRAFLGLLIGLALLLPLLIFDLRHGFINTQNVFRYLRFGTQGEIPPPPFFSGLWEKTLSLFQIIFPFSPSLVGLCAVFFTAAAFCFSLRDKLARLILVFFVGGIFFAGLYKGSFFPFYLTFLYPVPFLLVGLVFAKINKPLLAGLLLFVSLFYSVFQNQQTLANLGKGSLHKILLVSQSLSQIIPSEENFNLAALCNDPTRYDHNAVDYRYFLESYFNTPVPGWDVLDYQNAQTLYLISEIGPINIPKINFWELETFGPSSLGATHPVSPDIVIYKLVKN